MNKQRHILVFSAHNDDQIIGVGGALAKYTREGVMATVYVFSFGESSHPHLKRTEIAETRVTECKRSDKVLGVTNTIFLGLTEGSFSEDFSRKKLHQRLHHVLLDLQPEKIFLHSPDDLHPDHRAVYQLVTSLLDELHLAVPVYIYGVWNPLSLRYRDVPRLVVDISEEFSRKLRAFQCHESQFLTMLTMVPSMYFRALFAGIHYGYKYAEIFLKIR